MYKTHTEAVAFVKELSPALAPFSQVERVVCPPFIALAGVSEALAGTGIEVGAQSMHWEAQGAFTSQIAPTMLQGLVRYVIIGHSECRQYLNETDETVNKKVKAALAYGRVVGLVRNTLAELYGKPAAETVRIQYGGSVKPDNMVEYMSQPEIDGALVGGASLKVADFTRLIELAAQAKGL